MRSPAPIRIEALPITPLPKGVIFDCDGTLVDSMPAHYIGWCDAFAEHGYQNVLPADSFMAMGGMPGPEIIAHVGNQLGVVIDPLPILARKRQLVMDMLEKMLPLEPAGAWLRWCHHNQIPVAIGSGGTRRIVLASLESIGLLGFFDPAYVFTADEVSIGKPAPDLFLTAAHAIGVEPADCLVIEDGPPGIAAAMAAGMRCLDVRDYT